MKSLKFVFALSCVLGGAMLGQPQSAEANSPSGGGVLDEACAERCLNNWCSSRGLSCNAHSMNLAQTNQAVPTCRAQCSH